MENIIVYYSKYGTSRLAAKLLSEKFNCNVMEIEEKKQASFLKNCFRAVLKKESELKENYTSKIANIENIYLIFPIWASSGTPAINSFLKNTDFENKSFTIITYQLDKELKESGTVHEYIKNIINNKQGKVNKCYAFYAEEMGKCSSESLVKKQISEII